MSPYRDVASWCENSLDVSTACTPHGGAKCIQNEVELGASLARAATKWTLEKQAGRVSPATEDATGQTQGA